MNFTGFALYNGTVAAIFYFYSKSKIMTAQQYFREFLRKMYSKQLFRATVTSLERTIHAYR